MWVCVGVWVCLCVFVFMYAVNVIELVLTTKGSFRNVAFCGIVVRFLRFFAVFIKFHV